jgi:hypothetical protein
VPWRLRPWLEQQGKDGDGRCVAQGDKAAVAAHRVPARVGVKPEGDKGAAWQRAKWDRLTALTAGTDAGAGPTMHGQRARCARRRLGAGARPGRQALVFIPAKACLSAGNSNFLNYT